MSLHNIEQSPSNNDKRITQTRLDLLNIYQSLFVTIRERIEPTLGEITFTAITQRALNQASHGHTLLEQVHLSEEGLNFEGLRNLPSVPDREALGYALKALLDTFIDLLVMLTGDVLVRQLLHDVEYSDR